MLVRGGAEESSEKPITITRVGTGPTKLWFPSPHVKRARTYSVVTVNGSEKFQSIERESVLSWIWMCYRPSTAGVRPNGQG